MKFDPTRLLTQLQNTGLAVKDNPLFQLLFLMIDAIGKINAEINASLAPGGGGSTTNNITQIIQQLALDGGFDGGGDDISIPGPPGEDGANGMVPYFIAAGETFTVPEFKQALFAMNIDNEGILEIDGFLIEVDGGGGGEVVNNQTLILWEENYYDD